MRTLVTGSSGYLGAVVAPFLQSQGHAVVGVDAGFFNADHLSSGTTSYPIHALDIRNIKSDFFRDFDAVVHLAALSTNPLSDLDPHLTEEINHRATTDLAEKAKQNGVKHFIFASTCCVYGAEKDEVFTEESETHPSTSYAVTKLKAEEDLRKLADADFKVDILRNATVFGISPAFRSDIVVNSFILSGLLTGKITVFNQGTQWRPLVEIEDLAEVIRRLLDRPENLGEIEVFNVGFNENNFMVKDIIEPVLSVLPEVEVIYEAGSARDMYSYRSDFSKLKKVFPDLVQKNGLIDSMAKMKKSLQLMIAERSQGKIPLTSSMFHRHEQIKKLIEKKELTPSLRWVKS